MILEDYIVKHAQDFGSKTAIVDSFGSHTYSQLYADVLKHSANFSNIKGKAVVFRARQSYESVVEYFSIHLAGCVAVPLAADYPQESFDSIKELLSSSFFENDIADILFTTGTTGQSKGVKISYKAILANAENLVEAQKYEESITFIITGPLNHIGSLSKLYPSLLVGASIHILDGLRDMNAFFDAVDKAPHKVATFQVPASLKMLMTLANKQIQSRYDKFDFIETGAAAISQTDMEALCKLLPNTRLYNTYASTETGIIATHDFNNDLCLAGCLGKPMRNSKIKISPDGLIVCSGKTIMSGYWNDDELTAKVLRDDSIFTHDLAEIDDSGRLRLKGREDDTINIGGYKIAPTEVESQVMQISGIADCLCVASSHRVLGTILKLLIVPNDENNCPKPKEIANILRQSLENYKIPQQYEYTNHIERTFNGKPNRKAYSHK